MTTVGEEPLYQDRRRASSFGEDAEQYDRVRPAYPDVMVDALLAEQPKLVVDVGCGTGITTRLFSGRGCEVLGIEPDPRMAAVARRRGATVEDGSFEQWDARGRQFDLLVAGQSWHWVDPLTGARRAAEVLRPTGRIGLFWNQSFPAGPARQAMDSVYRHLAPELGAHSVLLGQRDDHLYGDVAQSLRIGQRFVDVRVERFSHEANYSTEDWLELAATHSDHRTLPGPDLERLIAALREAIDLVGGQVPVHYVTTLVTGRTATG
jgi:SAM-dependent methyltransferase